MIKKQLNITFLSQNIMNILLLMLNLLHGLLMVINELFGVSVCSQTIYNILKRHKITHKKIQINSYLGNN